MSIIELIWWEFDQTNKGHLLMEETQHFMVKFAEKHGIEGDFNVDRFKQFFIQFDINQNGYLDKNELMGFIMEILKMQEQIWIVTMFEEGEFYSDSDEEELKNKYRRIVTNTSDALKNMVWLFAFHMRDVVEGEVYYEQSHAEKRFNDMKGGQWSCAIFNRHMQQVAFFGQDKHIKDIETWCW